MNPGPAGAAPRLAPRDVLRGGLCVGCGNCAAQPGAPGRRMAWDRDGQLKPAGRRADLARADAQLARLCPSSPWAANEDELARALYPQAAHVDPLVGRYESAFVGSVAEGHFRAQGSSGGMVSWVATELLRRGLVDAVAHVVPTADPAADGRFFRYRLSRTPAQLAAGAKSRYYPVELSQVLEEIRATPGRYAVVGIPCFTKAVQLLRRHDPLMRDRIRFTLGLFCGHMKSARLLDSFAWQLSVDPAEVVGVEYRLKSPDRPANWYTAQLRLRDGRLVQRDWFHLAEGDWGSGFFQNGACNFCDDVVVETADISFGDAWVEPYAQDGRGTNVVLVRSPELHALVSEAIGQGRLALAPVDADFVRRTQAAGLRHRREGLAYRLTWARRSGLQPRKRVAEGATELPRPRKLLYRIRAHVTRWSPKAFRVARVLRWRGLYLAWAHGVVALYQGLAYARGRLGAALARMGWRG
ncbi:Coenzyme F420 hydrogenase/dehydrogenase, beta subunit C-terminal domain [Ramlibacter tataouinensis]|uniref:Coenzyme F420 hydrogenase/dehydrogenase, beta subunit C-terminal domain n=1 Tax=Ramlibacter tataouinensis TaxID=94132 RepID=UPI0022F38482|nr:Coenzyme F420 hydrogenase/dehydrogenase, beta subunit C-terminal domain [Ramlibacter tataouinensis]WBY02067.1 Coenzyme F420 hydrogenase/dehydrogenase, beta subunit C-terminal domain [Ramlibacter tataouinensis]